MYCAHHTISVRGEGALVDGRLKVKVGWWVGEMASVMVGETCKWFAVHEDTQYIGFNRTGTCIGSI